MKLWKQKATLNQWVEQFTTGQDRVLDLKLATYDILGSIAHSKMLAKVGLMSEEEQKQLHEALIRLYEKAEKGELVIEEGIEDIHSQVEFLLTEELGDIGKKIHSGRSRNDQVLLDLRLFFRAEIKEVVEETKALFDLLQQLSERYKDDLMPGYTHMQLAMVSSFGLWFGAYAESLVEDLRMMESVYRTINQNPLGSAAGYGNSFPLGRTMTTELLGFDTLSYNVVHAQMGRGKTELQLSFALASIAQTLGKFSMDVVLYLNQNFDFIRFPDEITTGSSIMPHKKNPDLFELVRARCNHIQSVPAQISATMINLPMGYHRDFQLLKEIIFPAIEQLKDCLGILQYALEKVEIKKELLKADKYKYLFSVEEVNKEVLKGLPFRDAYHKLSASIEAGTFDPERSIDHTHEGSIGNLCTEEIKGKMEEVIAQFNFGKTEEKVKKLTAITP
jgi:argininosuccinate lyase